LPAPRVPPGRGQGAAGGDRPAVGGRPACDRRRQRHRRLQPAAVTFAIPDAPDLARMRAARRARLHDALAAKDAAAAVLLGTTNVRWATGARVVAADQGRAAHFRNVAVVVAGDEWPHLFTHFADGVPDDHPADHVHAGVDIETDGGARKP